MFCQIEAVVGKIAAPGVEKPYMDPRLRRSRKLYTQLMAKLNRAGMVRLGTEAGRCEVGIFAVPKKDGRQRLVIDARRANCYFVDAPATEF